MNNILYWWVREIGVLRSLVLASMFVLVIVFLVSIGKIAHFDFGFMIIVNLIWIAPILLIFIILDFVSFVIGYVFFKKKKCADRALKPMVYYYFIFLACWLFIVAIIF